MEIIEISPDMTAMFGRGPVGDAPTPHDPVALVYNLGGDAAPATLHVDTAPSLRLLAPAGGGYRLIFLVARQAIVRLGGGALIAEGLWTVYLPSELRAIAAVLRDPPTAPLARSTYRGAKCIELFCETLRLHDGAGFIPVSRNSTLSSTDTRRAIEARRLIDERWSEKLTLEGIARACGLNRAKLARVFREVFDCTVAEALAERRFSAASQLLLTTDLPISSVGYEAGYLSNASFTRAFGRHFGLSPSDYRAGGLAA